MNRRNTIQRELVLKAVQSLHCHATADEIYTAISRDYPTIGRGTVYRNLSILTEEGSIRKVEVPGGADHYDPVCTPHYHMRCIRCNRVFDVEMDPLPDLRNLIRNPGGMEFLDFDLLFRGICPECRQALKEEI